jgi:hypothetical protein
MAHTADDRPPCPGSMSERAKRNDWTEEELEALGFASEMGGATSSRWGAPTSASGRPTNGRCSPT